MRNANRRRERGFTLLEIMIALAIAAVAIGVPLVALHTINHGVWHQAGMQRQISQLDQLVDQLDVSANSSLSVYTPPTTTTGAGCSSTAACSEVRFYGRDSSNGLHFWGWSYDAGTKTLSFCKSYAGADATSCASGGYALSNVTAFTATPSDGAAALGAGASGTHPVHLLSSGADAAQRVTAGDSVMVVDVRCRAHRARSGFCREMPRSLPT